MTLQDFNVSWNAFNGYQWNIVVSYQDSPIKKPHQKPDKYRTLTQTSKNARTQKDKRKEKDSVKLTVKFTVLSRQLN